MREAADSSSPGTILHLQQRKQRYKLQMFQRLWRVLILAVIAVAAFFVVSSMSLSNRLDEGEWEERRAACRGHLMLRVELNICVRLCAEELEIPMDPT